MLAPLFLERGASNPVSFPFCLFPPFAYSPPLGLALQSSMWKQKALLFASTWVFLFRFLLFCYLPWPPYFRKKIHPPKGGKSKRGGISKRGERLLFSSMWAFYFARLPFCLFPPSLFCSFSPLSFCLFPPPGGGISKKQF